MSDSDYISALMDALRNTGTMSLEECQRMRREASIQAGKEFDAFRDEVLEGVRQRKADLAAGRIKNPTIEERRAQVNLEKKRALPLEKGANVRPTPLGRPKKGTVGPGRGKK